MADKCLVTDGRLIEPCKDIREFSTDNRDNRRKEMYIQRLINIQTREFTRFNILVYSHKGWVASAYCPACGTQLIYSEEEIDNAEITT